MGAENHLSVSRFRAVAKPWTERNTRALPFLPSEKTGEWEHTSESTEKQPVTPKPQGTARGHPGVMDEKSDWQ